MYKKILLYMGILILIVVISAFLLMKYTNKQPSTDDVKEKVKEEMHYLDKEILGMMNQLNNLQTNNKITTTDVESKNSKESQQGSEEKSSSGESSSSSGTSDSKESSSSQSNSKENNTIEISKIYTESILKINKDDIDWDELQRKMENINNSWAIITIDLKSLNISNENILSFNSISDNALNYLKNKDKQNSLICIANLYTLIPKYQLEYQEEYQKVQITQIKSDVISAYALLGTDKWEDIENVLSNADNKAYALLNSADLGIEDNKDIQKTYILLKDLIKSVNDRDLDLCYMKYYYLIDGLEQIL